LHDFNLPQLRKGRFRNVRFLFLLRLARQVCMKTLRIASGAAVLCVPTFVAAFLGTSIVLQVIQ
jgi:hypothetical protein